jgi:hypothetical protein
MIDAFTLFLSHGLVFLTAWRLLSRPDLDRDPEEPRRGGLERPLRGGPEDARDA